MSIIAELKAKKADIQKQIDAIQEACSHPEAAVIKKHGSNTGNYDPSSDCYWTDFHCQLCDKFWTQDGSV